MVYYFVCFIVLAKHSERIGNLWEALKHRHIDTWPHTNKCMCVWWCLALTPCNTIHPQQSVARYKRMVKEREIDRESRQNQVESHWGVPYVSVHSNVPPAPLHHQFHCKYYIERILSNADQKNPYTPLSVTITQCPMDHTMSMLFYSESYKRPRQLQNWKTDWKTSTYNTNQIRQKRWDKNRYMKTKSTYTLIYIIDLWHCLHAKWRSNRCDCHSCQISGTSLYVV